MRTRRTLNVLLAMGILVASGVAGDTPPTFLQAIENNIATTQFDMRPLGDRNRPPLGTDGKEMHNPDGTLLTVGMTAPEARLTFSETVSYHLYFCALAAESALRENDPKRAEKFFDDATTSWAWARNNMQRKNIKDVLSFDDGPNLHQRIPVPNSMRDHLLAWRWVQNIGSLAGVSLGDGIISQTQDPAKTQHPWNKTFHDGLQSASDSEVLISHALLKLAELSGNNNERAQQWRKDAIALIRDTRNKLILDIQPGILLQADRPVPANFFTASWPVSGRSGTITIEEHPDANTSVRFSGRQCCVGLGFSTPLDLTALDAIELQISGSGSIEVHLQDVHPADRSRPHSGDSNPGRIVYNEIRLSRTPRTIILPATRFKPFPYHGNQSGKFDFGGVASLALQLSRNGEVNVHSLSIKLKPEAITNDWAGKHLVHSAQGEPYLNVSYWMPWIFEEFAKAEPDYADFWREIGERSYRHARTSSTIRLNAFPAGNEPPPVIQGNGALVPNFFAIHALTGHPENLPYESPSSMIGHVMGHDAFRTYYFVTKSLLEQHKSGQPLNPDGLHLVKAMADFLVPFIIDTEGRPPAMFRIDGEPVGTHEAPVGMRAVYWALYEFLLTVAPEASAQYRQCANLLAESLKEDLIVDHGGHRAWWNAPDPFWRGSQKEEYFQQYWSLFALKLIHEINPPALEPLWFPSPTPE